jgi:hypothetical protein
MTATEMEEILAGLGVEYRIDTMGLVEPLDIVYRAYVAIPDEFSGDRVGSPISISIDPDGKITQLYIPIQVAVADMVKAFGNPTFLGQDGVSNIVGYPELGLFFLFPGVESERTFLVLIRI